MGKGKFFLFSDILQTPISILMAVFHIPEVKRERERERRFLLQDLRRFVLFQNNVLCNK